MFFVHLYLGFIKTMLLQRYIKYVAKICYKTQKYAAKVQYFFHTTKYLYKKNEKKYYILYLFANSSRSIGGKQCHLWVDIGRWSSCLGGSLVLWLDGFLFSIEGVDEACDSHCEPEVPCLVEGLRRSNAASAK